MRDNSTALRFYASDRRTASIMEEPGEAPIASDRAEVTSRCADYTASAIAREIAETHDCKLLRVVDSN